MCPTPKVQQTALDVGTVGERLTEAEEREEIQVGKLFPPEIGYGKPPPQTLSFAAETALITGESV